MALIDEAKLQGRILEILEILRKQQACCTQVASASWASSSIIAGGVFVVIYQNGSIGVFDSPGGTLLLPADYGTLSKP